MGRILNIWRGWSTAQRLSLAGGLAAVLAGGAVAAYLVLKREGDETCRPDCPVLERREKRKVSVEKVNWPVYGYDDARTRYLPTKRVHPPYDASEWSFNAGTLLEFSPVLQDGRLYVVDKNAVTIAIDAGTGKIRWKHDVGGLSAASPAIAGDRLFVVTLEPGDIQAMDPETGRVIWEKDLGARSETSPVVYGDTVIVGNESGTLFALDVKNGETKWTVSTAGPIKGGAALGEGILYAGNYAGELYAIRASDGSVKWQTGTQGSSFGRTGSIYSTPAVAFGRVFVGSIDGRVYSFDADTGSLAWSQSTGDWVYPAPAVADVAGKPTVYIGSKDKTFYALDAETGDIRWKDDTGGIILGAASVIGDVVYVGVIGPMNGTIGYDASSGKRVFENDLGEYNPAITDGNRLFLTGASGVRAFSPEPKPEGKRKGEEKGAKGEEKDAGGEPKGAKKQAGGGKPKDAKQKDGGGKPKGSG